jgi:UDP-GlcNAc:undecaprenyl-phosphate GlcNAc-1-phosphate transferase
MILGLSELFLAILMSATTALLSAPGMIQIATRLGLVDQPGSARHKQHQSPTPMAGGLILVASIAVSLILLKMQITADLMAILSGFLVTLIIGLVDDWIDLKPGYKLFGQLVASSTVIYFGIQVHITQIASLDLGLTVLWLVGMANAFNFVDSMDGLAVGIAGIAAAFFMLVAVDSFQPDLAIISAILLGTMIGSFIYSSPPARMFLGDSGSQALGIMLGSIGIAYTPGQAGLPQAATWFVPILALGVPIFDMVLVVFSRIRRMRPIYEANTDHIYHRLTRLGLHPNRAVLLMQITAILLSLCAFIALGTSVYIANAIFGMLVFGSLLILGYLEFRLDGNELY